MRRYSPAFLNRTAGRVTRASEELGTLVQEEVWVGGNGKCGEAWREEMRKEMAGGATRAKLAISVDPEVAAGHRATSDQDHCKPNLLLDLRLRELLECEESHRNVMVESSAARGNGG